MQLQPPKDFRRRAVRRFDAAGFRDARPLVLPDRATGERFCLERGDCTSETMASSKVMGWRVIAVLR